MEQLLLAALICSLILCLLLAVAWRRSAGRGSRRSKARVRRAQAGEAAAERLLAEHGFEVVGSQERGEWTITVDGEEHTVSVRADLLVERDGDLYVAEVKTGDVAPNPLHPATRRQLLEYLLIFEPVAVLLVDVEEGDVMEVEFPSLLVFDSC